MRLQGRDCREPSAVLRGCAKKYGVTFSVRSAPPRRRPAPRRAPSPPFSRTPSSLTRPRSPLAQRRRRAPWRHRPRALPPPPHPRSSLRVDAEEGHDAKRPHQGTPIHAIAAQRELKRMETLPSSASPSGRAANTQSLRLIVHRSTCRCAALASSGCSRADHPRSAATGLAGSR